MFCVWCSADDSIIYVLRDKAHGWVSTADDVFSVQLAVAPIARPSWKVAWSFDIRCRSVGMIFFLQDTLPSTRRTILHVWFRNHPVPFRTLLPPVSVRRTKCALFLCVIIVYVVRWSWDICAPWSLRFLWPDIELSQTGLHQRIDIVTHPRLRIATLLAHFRWICCNTRQRKKERDIYIGLVLIMISSLLHLHLIHWNEFIARAIVTSEALLICFLSVAILDDYCLVCGLNIDLQWPGRAKA